MGAAPVVVVVVVMKYIDYIAAAMPVIGILRHL
jgi:hypothetical protein